MNMRKTILFKSLIAVIVLFIVFVLLWYGFRVKTLDYHPGIARIEYRWWRPVIFEWDSNGNGEINEKWIYSWSEPFDPYVLNISLTNGARPFYGQELLIRKPHSHGWNARILNIGKNSSNKLLFEVRVIDDKNRENVIMTTSELTPDVFSLIKEKW